MGEQNTAMSEMESYKSMCREHIRTIRSSISMTNYWSIGMFFSGISITVYFLFFSPGSTNVEYLKWGLGCITTISTLALQGFCYSRKLRLNSLRVLELKQTEFSTDEKKFIVTPI